MSRKHPRYGYRRITALLRREGFEVNPKRVARIRREEGLKVSKRQRKTRCLGLSTAERLKAEKPRQVWSWDFVEDQTENGSRFRILTLIDEYTRECLATHAAWSIRAVDVITVVEAAIARYGAPEHIRSDNGPEFISYAIGDWLEHAKIKTLYIRPGSPWKTVTSKASMTSCATSVSIGSSSAPSLKPESSWKAGAWNTTKPALTARLATRRPESTPGGTTLIFGRPTASLRSGLHQPTKPSTTSTNQPQRNFSFDVSHPRGQATPSLWNPSTPHPRASAS